MTIHMDLLFVISLSGIIGGVDALTACPDTWVPFQGSCYLFAHSNLTFPQAVVNCKSHDAEIVKIETSEENRFIEDQARSMKGNGFWIGLTDELVEGVWEWHDTDTVAEFTDWGPGEPNNSGVGEDCAMIYPSKDYHWNDYQCSTRYFQHICELRGESENMEIVG